MDLCNPKCSVCDDPIKHPPEWMCRPCQVADEAAEEQRVLGMLVRHSRDAKLITDETVHLSFDASQADIEARNREAWLTVRMWHTRGKRANLFIHGIPGVGKTFLARCCLVESLRTYVKRGQVGAEGPTSGPYVCEATSVEICYNGLRFGQEAKFRTWCRARVMLVDDIDKAHMTEFTFQAFWELVNARSQSGRRTIYTSNIDRAEYSRRLIKSAGSVERAQALVDRMKPCLTIEMAGTSNRPQGPEG